MTGFVQYKAKIKYAAPMSRSIYVAVLGKEECEVCDKNDEKADVSDTSKPQKLPQNIF